MSVELQELRWFNEEIHPHEPALRTWLRARFPGLSDIDDIIQETYAQIFRARKAGKIEAARPYLFAVARNTVKGLFRRRKIVSFERLGESDWQSVAAEAPGIADTVAHHQELALLAEAISQLPERCRQVLTLRKLHGLSHREIAQKLGISENTVNAHGALGVLRCREYLAARGYLGEGSR
jgi:RNA polymerase sigma-70 factor (ECF subfamily)